MNISDSVTRADELTELGQRARATSGTVEYRGTSNRAGETLLYRGACFTKWASPPDETDGIPPGLVKHGEFR